MLASLSFLRTVLTSSLQTDEARADLGRLAEIRKQREAAAARRKAETEGSFSLTLRLAPFR